MSQQSDVARLRAQIAREQQAACWALSGLADGTTRHRFISRRMERMGAHQQELSHLVGERASMQMVVEILEQHPLHPSAEPQKGPDNGRDHHALHSGH